MTHSKPMKKVGSKRISMVFGSHLVRIQILCKKSLFFTFEVHMAGLLFWRVSGQDKLLGRKHLRLGKVFEKVKTTKFCSSSAKFFRFYFFEHVFSSFQKGVAIRRKMMQKKIGGAVFNFLVVVAIWHFFLNFFVLELKFRCFLGLKRENN